MNKFKKILFLFLSIIMIFSLVACGDSNKTDDDNATKENEISDYISIIDLPNVTFKVPPEIHNALVRNIDVEEVDDNNYYLDIWDNYMELAKGDFSEAFMIEIKEDFEEKDFQDLSLESVQKILEEDAVSGIDLKEVVFEDDNKVIFLADVSAEIPANAGNNTFEGNGYVVVISEDERELLAVLISKNTEDSNNKKLFEMAKSIEFIDYDKYKIEKKDSHKAKEFINIKTVGNIEIEVPKFFYDYRINAYGLLFAGEEVLDNTDEDMVYWMSTESFDSFVMALSDMSANILVERFDNKFDTVEEIESSEIEEFISSYIFVSDFECEKILDDSGKKIFKISLETEEEGLSDEIIELSLDGYVGVYEIEDSIIFAMTLSDSSEDNWKLRFVQNLKEFK